MVLGPEVQPGGNIPLVLARYRYHRYRELDSLRILLSPMEGAPLLWKRSAAQTLCGSGELVINYGW